MSTMQVPAGTAILSARNILALVGVWLVYKVLQAVYNISPFHPLSGIPGPKLAAATYLPEFYHDVVRFGCYSKEIRKMHEEFGMSVVLRLCYWLNGMLI
jgi:hypothetical protein